MRSCLLATIILLPLISPAQRVVDVGKQEVRAGDAEFFFVVSGTPFINTKFVRVVQGSPYFRDQWMKGSVMVNGGKEYSNLLLKLELIDNHVHYTDSSNSEMIASGDLKQVKLFDTVNQKVFTFIHSDYINAAVTPRGWYQLLADGKYATLFKQNGKRLREMKPYGSATYEQYIDDYDRLLVWYNNNFTEAKKIKDLAEILSDKKTEILEYINQHKLSKSENDFISVVNYYNSIR